MARIQEFQPRATPRTLPTPFEGAPRPSGLQELGQTLTKGTEQVGKALARRESRLAGEKARADTSFRAANIAKEDGLIAGEYDHFLYNPEDGFMRTQGEKTLDGTEGALKTVAEIARARLAAIKDPQTRALAEGRFIKHANAARSQIYGHSAKQGTAVKNRAWTVAASGWVNTALKAQDTLIRDDAVGEVGNVAMLRARDAGFTTDEILDEGRLARGEVNHAILQQMADDAPEAAKNYLARPDVAASLGAETIEDLTTVIDENAQNSFVEGVSTVITGISQDGHGYMDPNRAEEVLAGLLNPETRDKVAEALLLPPDELFNNPEVVEDLKEAIEEAQKAEDGRKRRDVGDAYGRGFEAMVNAAEAGHRSPLKAVPAADKLFLRQMGGDGNKHWQDLRRVAASYERERKSLNKGGHGRSELQAHARNIIKEQINSRIPKVVNMSAGEFFKAYSTRVSVKDVRALWDDVLRVRNAEGREVVQDTGMKIFRDIARGKGLPEKKSEPLTASQRQLDNFARFFIESREDGLRSEGKRPTFQDYQGWTRDLLLMGDHDVPWDVDVEELDSTRVGQAAAAGSLEFFTIDVDEMDQDERANIERALKDQDLEVNDKSITDFWMREHGLAQ